jgi:ABC-type uncharacterized transport system substrate-binding protein
VRFRKTSIAGGAMNLIRCAVFALVWLGVGMYAQAGQRILWIDSYNQGNAWSDGVQRGIMDVLKGNDVELKIHRMDTKRNKAESFKKAAAKKANNVIKKYKPDIVIASDDNASKYLVMPYLKDAALPVVFCGVNHSADKYGYPYKNATGIIELDPIEKLFYSMSFFTRMEKVGYLAGDTVTSRINGDSYVRRIRVDLLERYVNTFSEWQSAFLQLQEDCDMLVIGNVSAINDWDGKKAYRFVLNQTRIPTGCVLEIMASYSMIGFIKLPEEQGRWAARTALRVLSGEKISNIPLGSPVEGRLILNKLIAESKGIRFPKSFVKNADRIIE